MALVRCSLKVEVWEELAGRLQSSRRRCGQKSTSQQLVWERTRMGQEQEGTSPGGGQENKTQMWGEASSREEGGTALCGCSLNLGDRELWKGRYHSSAQSKPPTPEGESRAGPCGKRGLHGSTMGAQGSAREPAGPAEQLHTGSPPNGTKLASGLLHLNFITSPICAQVNKVCSSLFHLLLDLKIF